MAIPETFGERLRAAMRAAAVRNDDVARATGVHVKTVSQWLSDRFEPSDEKLEVLANLLRVAPARLKYGDGPPTPIARAMGVSDVRGATAEPPAARHARHLPLAVREYLAELRLRLTKGGATEEEIDEAMDLLRSPAVFTFYKGGHPSEFNEADVLRGMKAIAEGVIIPELRDRGRKIR